MEYKKELLKKMIFIIFLFVLTSCKSAFLTVALNDVGAFDDRLELKSISNNDKNVLFMGMHHIGRKEFYDDVSRKTDSLQKIGYVVFFEKLKKNDELDSISNDIYKKKFRKITGVTTAKLYDTINNVVGGKIKYRGKYKLINQPDYSKINVNMETAKNVDVEMVDMIKAFELKHGEVTLDDCDEKTRSDVAVYDCDRIDTKLAQIFSKEFIISLRDKNLANAINYSTEKNILVIYGKVHFGGLITELNALDSNWK